MSSGHRDNPQWQETAPEQLLTTPVADVLSSKVRCSRTGVEKSFFRFRFPPWVNIIAVTPELKIVMIHQYRFGTGKVELEIPGGAVENGEDPVEAGLRELLEETGYSGDNARLIGQVCPNPALQDNLCHTVLVENAVKTAPPAPDEMEDIEVLLMEVSEVMSLVTEGSINHGLVLNGLMFYFMTKNSDSFTLRGVPTP